MQLSAPVAIVTGGASGMGAATARLLAREGYRVAIVDKGSEQGNAVADEVGGVAHIGSVADSAFCAETVGSVLATFGRIDVLINAAGVIVRATAANTTDEQWREIFSVNVDGVFFMSRAVIPSMREANKGAIVNFGSIWGSVGAAGHSAYAATKGAVHQLTKSMALEHARDGIRINAVCPGEIRTPMLASERLRPPTEDELAELADATVPMGRLGEPEEVAAVVAFIASDAASYMTGSMVTVDAGFTAR
ncbi:MAG: SDR family oxidoreductase [Acidimicrobiia bacterium]|nr:SDR family oxidoreductase [Acidimicrobiia bacterium]